MKLKYLKFFVAIIGLFGATVAVLASNDNSAVLEEPCIENIDEPTL